MRSNKQIDINPDELIKKIHAYACAAYIQGKKAAIENVPDIKAHELPEALQRIEKFEDLIIYLDQFSNGRPGIVNNYAKSINKSNQYETSVTI